MCRLANRFPAPCTAIAGSTTPSIGYGLRRSGKHGLREHVLTDKLTSNFACGNSRLHHPTNRVSPSAGAASTVRASMSSLAS